MDNNLETLERQLEVRAADSGLFTLILELLHLTQQPSRGRFELFEGLDLEETVRKKPVPEPRPVTMLFHLPITIPNSDEGGRRDSARAAVDIEVDDTILSTRSRDDLRLSGSEDDSACSEFNLSDDDDEDDDDSDLYY
eukprot:TRINITY_DN4019_c0_g1_i1.p1 TRINITY_DN4019_c0_g1~~TRINITY_DN4019_c0_g1_i1.p1  ORF type:complete len:138 (+),score=40.45 TRINITY_DN4019_c0_g1_i1:136-549(+)